MLTPALDRYLEMRRALGFKLESTEYYLRRFVRLADERGDTHICRQTAIDWTAGITTPRQRDKSLRMLISFARFLYAEDSRHAIPTRDSSSPTPPRPAPYIFSLQEIQLLGEAAQRIGQPGSLRRSTYTTLFNLLAVTGLRISEALNLRIDEFTPDGLVILETKFRKSRLVPIHATTAAAMGQYLERRRHAPSNHDRFFVSSRRKPLCYDTIQRMFQRLCMETGIRGAPHIPRPRLHDLRHSVAVRMLAACPNDRDQVTPHMLALSTYLGHSSLQGTYWYLHSSPPLMLGMADTTEAWFSGGRT
jgi:integrase/recombinase XerD